MGLLLFWWEYKYEFMNSLSELNKAQHITGTMYIGLATTYWALGRPTIP